ncbi:MAG: IS1634 family transposase [Acidobacteria bacterium]|nr:IS1634 family transposase [Acidobacteriota bacterium]
MPVIQSFLDQLDLGDIIDRVVPWEGHVPLGTLTEILVANRLLTPAPLYRIGQWAQLNGLTDFYEVTAAQLNDDLLGRGLERIAKHAHDIEAAIVLRAVKVFDLKLARIHYDLTSVELYGAYQNYVRQMAAEHAGQQPNTAAPDGQPTAAEPEADADYQPPQPTYGRSKSGRKNLKQVQLGINVIGDGAVPIGHTVLDGNTAEATTHQANLQRLKGMLPNSPFLLIMDSKGDTQENLLDIKAEGCEFLCTGAFTPELQQRYLALKNRMHKIDYYPKSQEQRAPEDRDEYRAHEVKELLQGEVKGRAVRLRYRLIFVSSQARARQQSQTRERHTDKIRTEFEKTQKNLNKYKLKTRAEIVARLEKAKGKYVEGKLFCYELRGRAGRFRLNWRVDEKELQRRKELEGVYVLKTNWSRTEHPVVEVLRTYKEQSNVEKRIGHIKGPLAVAPAFLENPQRIAGLLAVVVWALLILALTERQVRRGLKGKPILGLYPENRPCMAPSGPTILKCFSTLCVVLYLDEGRSRRQLAQLTALQQALLDLLDILETDLRCYARSSYP